MDKMAMTAFRAGQRFSPRPRQVNERRMNERENKKTTKKMNGKFPLHTMFVDSALPRSVYVPKIIIVDVRLRQPSKPDKTAMQAMVRGDAKEDMEEIERIADSVSGIQNAIIHFGGWPFMPLERLAGIRGFTQSCALDFCCCCCCYCV